MVNTLERTIDWTEALGETLAQTRFDLVLWYNSMHIQCRADFIDQGRVIESLSRPVRGVDQTLFDITREIYTGTSSVTMGDPIPLLTGVNGLLRSPSLPLFYLRCGPRTTVSIEKHTSELTANNHFELLMGRLDHTGEEPIVTVLGPSFPSVWNWAEQRAEAARSLLIKSADGPYTIDLRTHHHN